MAFLSMTGSTLADEPTDPRLERIFADWQNRRERIKRVRYRVSGEHVLPKGSFGDPNTGQPLGPDSPPHDISWPKIVVLLLDFTTNRHRLEEEEQPYGQTHGQFLPKRVSTTVFDSKELWTQLNRPAGVRPDPKTPDVYEVSGNMRGQAFGSDYWPLFVGHGIVPLTTLGHVLPGRLLVTPEKDVYHIHGEGVYASRACVVLRTEAYEFGNKVGLDELWVDIGRESAILRQVAHSNDKIVTDIQIEYQDSRAGSLPQRWSITHAHTDGQVFSIERMHVDDLEIEPPVRDADFHVDVKPDMIVQQISIPGSPDQVTMPQPTLGRLFRVGSNGSWNEIVGGVEQNARWPIYLVGAVILLLAGAGAAVVLWRRRRRA
jgi:hypothetical protein